MCFINLRHHLIPDGALWVICVNECEIVRGDGHGQLGVGQLRALNFGLGKIRDVFLQLLQRGDTVLELPTPVGPVFIGNLIPQSFAGSVEHFQFLQNVTLSCDCWH